MQTEKAKSSHFDRTRGDKKQIFPTLEQNRTRLALEVIRSASKNACSSAKKTSTVPIMPNQQKNQPSKCIWGPKCTSKAELCAQIIIQEADILRTMRHYKQAVQVNSLF